MSSTIPGDPATGEPTPVTRADLDTARRMALRRAPPADADDVAQEATIELAGCRRPLRIPPGHTAEDARRFVLCAITRRRAARLHAAHARARSHLGDPVSTRERSEHARHLERWHGAAPSIEEQILERARLTLLHAAVDKLRTDAPDVHAVIEGQLDGVPIARLAVDLGIPLGTAYGRARRGLEALRAQLQRWAHEETRGEARTERGAARRAGSDGRDRRSPHEGRNRARDPTDLVCRLAWP
jgi:DNA-directed RNA polymerase specialized sigma24 family protein